MIVIDASLVVAVMINVADASRLNDRLDAAAGVLVAPEILDLEVLQVMRCLVRNRDLASRASQAFQTLDDLRIERFSHVGLRDRIWALRHNLTAYDAAYFALAEALDVPLWTRDAKFADAPGVSARVVVL